MTVFVFLLMEPNFLHHQFFSCSWWLSVKVCFFPSLLLSSAICYGWFATLINLIMIICVSEKWKGQHGFSLYPDVLFFLHSWQMHMDSNSVFSKIPWQRNLSWNYAVVHLHFLLATYESSSLFNTSAHRNGTWPSFKQSNISILTLGHVTFIISFQTGRSYCMCLCWWVAMLGVTQVLNALYNYRFETFTFII